MTSCAWHVSCNMEGAQGCRQVLLFRDDEVKRRRVNGRQLYLTFKEAVLHRIHELINDLDDSLINWLCYVWQSDLFACICPQRTARQNRYDINVLCNVCKSITSVHDTAKGFWGISLGQSEADVAERIWDTLHRPDDTWSTGQRGYCERFAPAVRHTVCVHMFYTNNELHKSFRQPQVSLIFTLSWCFIRPAAAGKELRKPIWFLRTSESKDEF